MNFNFIASDNFDITNFKNIKDFVGNYPDFQTVVLNNENELKLLLQLMNIHQFREHEVNDSRFFSKYWDLSDNKLPELNDQQFEHFYKDWLKKSKKENTMDEYGSLIFLQELSHRWNNLNYRLIIKEK